MKTIYLMDWTYFLSKTTGSFLTGIHDELSNYDLLNYNGKTSFIKAILSSVIARINYYHWRKNCFYKSSSFIKTKTIFFQKADICFFESQFVTYYFDKLLLWIFKMHL